MLLPNFSNSIFLLCLFFTLLAATKPLNLTLPHQHPSPDSVALHVIRDDQGQSGNSYSPYGGGGSSGGGTEDMGGMGGMDGTTRGSSSSSDDGNVFDMIFGSDAPSRPRLTLLFYLLMISVLSLSTLLLW